MVPSDVKVVLDVSPLFVGEQVAEVGVTLGDSLVTAKLASAKFLGLTHHLHRENVLVRQFWSEFWNVAGESLLHRWCVNGQPLVCRFQRADFFPSIARFLPSAMPTNYHSHEE